MKICQNVSMEVVDNHHQGKSIVGPWIWLHNAHTAEDHQKLLKIILMLCSYFLLLPGIWISKIVAQAITTFSATNWSSKLAHKVEKSSKFQVASSMNRTFWGLLTKVQFLMETQQILPSRQSILYKYSWNYSGNIKVKLRQWSLEESRT